MATGGYAARNERREVRGEVPLPPLRLRARLNSSWTECARARARGTENEEEEEEQRQQTERRYSQRAKMRRRGLK